MKKISYQEMDFSEEINRFELAEKLAKANEQKMIQESATFADKMEAKISAALFMENIQEANRLFNILNRMNEIGLRVI